MRNWFALLTLSLTAAHAQDAVRLVFVDAASPTAQVLDLQEKKVVGQFTVPGPAAGVYATPSKKYAVLVHRNENRITFLHSGFSTVDHGEHQDLVKNPPHVLQTIDVGRQPTHYFAHGDQMVFFNDQDGTVALMKESLLGLSMDTQTIKAEIPDHGAPALLGNHLLIGYLKLNRVDAVDLQTLEVKNSFPGCPGLHGEALLGNTVAYGCQDGVLLIQNQNGALSSQKFSNPSGTAEGVRVGTVLSHPEASGFFGNWGKGVVRIDTQAGLQPIPLSSTFIKGAFDGSGQTLVVLTADGQLHEISADGKLKRSAQVVSPVDLAVSGVPRPGLAVHEGQAYVTDPATGEIVQVNLADWKVSSSFKVGGKPTGVVALTIENAVDHE
ncbi:hypothetical protein [Deinococcus cellulosilyticus]|uniref:Uncharacterized protein n=1 Tax=Deinococcus cellulosilyticus (strain DSM 18568 / NBRC 106333 / KACC 11606 / 5516J-15) TaxID=1223518 RepID=A0A511MY80_DEIC1|nr:hypothetical protein [Deinococcus cellulosilyticus]GEM45248.1 hypothetical protein DC3_08830 [Deinococcus cellulosilyticus NBRC 106333 = KACC 11606]